MSSIVACDSGTSAAPPTPCSSRNTTICGSVCAAPHSIDVAVNPARHMMNSRLRPNRTAIHPTGAVMIAAEITYDVSTQVISSCVADRLPCMYGSATLAIAESSTCIRVAIITHSVISARCGTTRSSEPDTAARPAEVDAGAAISPCYAVSAVVGSITRATFWM